jgi:uncharacterized protein YfcZ (UPF0381/DUF406 family)
MNNYTEQYQFRMINSEGKEILYTCKSDIETWYELIREFDFFLQANSFIFKNNTIFDRVEGQYEW